METYFTFPDGRLRYDCPSCRQHCCRGRGFAFGADELLPLVGKEPRLVPHLFLRGTGSIAAVDLTDGCWFLAADGNCTIEVEHGRQYKPSTCRLFPFNRVYKVGDVRIVDVNTLLCPLQIVDGGGVTHDELNRELAALAGSPLIDVGANTPLHLPDDWLAIERRVAEACRAHAADADALAAATGEDCAPLVDAWLRVYGMTRAELAAFEAEVAPRVALLTPSLRWNTLFKKDAGNYAATAGRLARRVRALSFIGALAGRARGRVPSLRDLTELVQLQAFTIDVLASWTEPVHLLNPSFNADIEEPFRGALGTLLAAAYRGPGRTLGELVEQSAGLLAAPLRPMAIAVAATQMALLFPYGT